MKSKHGNFKKTLKFLFLNMIYRRGIHTREKYLFPDNPYYVPMSTFLTCREYKYDKNFIINYLDVVEYKGTKQNF